MLRDRSNCTVMLVEPSELTEVISVTPGICENCRSSGVATLEAMVSGLAPGRLALTWMVGKSTSGSAATGRLKIGDDAEHQEAPPRSARWRSAGG